MTNRSGRVCQSTTLLKKPGPFGRKDSDAVCGENNPRIVASGYRPFTPQISEGKRGPVVYSRHVHFCASAAWILHSVTYRRRSASLNSHIVKDPRILV